MDRFRLTRSLLVVFASLMFAVLQGCATKMRTPTFYVTGDAVVASQVCIIVNDAVTDSGVVSVMQIALRENGVKSVLYRAGTEPPECRTVLEYAVVMGMAKDAASGVAHEYWSSVDVNVLQDRAIAVMAHYDSNDARNRASAAHMLSAIVRSLVKPTAAEKRG